MLNEDKMLLSHLKSIVDILGTTKASLWPFWERTGTLVSGIALGDFTSAETGGTAEALEDDFSPIQHPGGLYTYHFHPTGDHHLAGVDNAAFSFGDGSVDSACSWGGLIIPSARASNVIMSKYDSAGGAEEYRFWLDANGKLSLELHDASESASETATGDTTIALGKPQFVMATYDGGETAPVAKLYIDAKLDNDGSTVESGAYVAMENTATPLLIGAGGVTATPTTEFHGRIGLPILTGKELSAAEIKALFSIYRLIFGLA